MKYQPPRISNHLSGAVTKITILRYDLSLGPATGFFYRNEEKIYLLTNRHVVTLRDNETNECLHEKMAEPNRIAYHLGMVQTDSDGNAFLHTQNQEEVLFDREGERRWLEHPTRGGAVDVVAVLVGSDPRKLTPAINDYDFIEQILRPGTEALIVGFPFGAMYRSRLPLWKHGIIATEPSFDYDKQPRFLVDSVTHKGMSGSPVFARTVFGVWNKGPKGEIKEDTLFSEAIDFAGVYSGRMRWPNPESGRELTNEERLFQMQIGVVWRAELVEEIVTQRILSIEDN